MGSEEVSSKRPEFPENGRSEFAEPAKGEESSGVHVQCFVIESIEIQVHLPTEDRNVLLVERPQCPPHLVVHRFPREQVICNPGANEGNEKKPR